MHRALHSIKWFAIAVVLALVAQVTQAAQVTALPVGNTATMSADIVCTSGGTISATVFGGPVPTQGETVSRTAGGVEVLLGSLDRLSPVFAMTPYCPGTFHVERPDLTSTGAMIGAVYDLGGTGSVGSVSQGTTPWVTDCTANGCATATNQATGNTTLSTIASTLATISTYLSGVSTAANQATAQTSFSSMVSSLSSIVTNTTGVSTAANQSTANSYLSTLATTITTLATAANQTAQQFIVGSTTASRFSQTNVAGQPAGAPTYMAFLTGYTGYATPTDLVCISGSSTKLVYVATENLLMTATAAAHLPLTFVKRSSLDTGGSGTTLSLIPVDSNDPAATATVTYYGAAPTLGSTVGTVGYSGGDAVSTTTAQTNANIYSSVTVPALDTFNKSVVLRNANEAVCINEGGAALPSGFTSTLLVQISEANAP